MVKLTKDLFADTAPEFGDADEDAQHVFKEEEEHTTPPAPALTAFQKLLAISDRVGGEPLPIMSPKPIQMLEDDLDISPSNGA